MAGVVILLEGLSSVAGHLVIPGRFVVAGDPIATAGNILSQEALYRLGPVLALVSVALHIAWVVLFYELFRPVSRTGSQLAAAVGLIAVALQAGSVIAQLAPLRILHFDNGESSAALTDEQLRQLASLALEVRAEAFNVYLVVFGCWCLITGWLIVRSRFIPPAIGLLEMLAGIGYLVLLWAPLAAALHPYYLALGVGEVILMLWLLIRGVDDARWQERRAGLAARDGPLAPSVR